MLQAAAAFGGGFIVKKHLDGVQLPQFGRAGKSTPAFKLSVRIVAASVPALGAPGLMSQVRPFLEATLGTSKKETEFADFSRKSDKVQQVGVNAEECPWTFGDTLTFKAKPEDVCGPGLKLALRVRKDIVLGPVQMEMQASDVGVATIDLMQRVLPACVQARHDVVGAADTWDSPMMLVPMAHVTGGVCGAECKPGDAVAHVAMVFSLDMDPETVLAAGGADSWPRLGLAEASKKIEDGMDGMMKWLDAHAWLPTCSPDDDDDGVEASEAPMPRPRSAAPSAAPLAEATPQSPAALRAMGSGASDASTLKSPDLDPEGWVSLEGPGGRRFWHHRALGPPPWEALAAAEMTGQRASSSSSSSASAGRIRSGSFRSGQPHSSHSMGRGHAAAPVDLRTPAPATQQPRPGAGYPRGYGHAPGAQDQLSRSATGLPRRRADAWRDAGQMNGHYSSHSQIHMAPRRQALDDMQGLCMAQPSMGFCPGPGPERLLCAAAIPRAASNPTVQGPYVA